MEEQKHHCIVCGNLSEKGIHICEQWICAMCEDEIVQTDVEDEKYPFFIHQLRQIWYKSNV